MPGEEGRLTGDSVSRCFQRGDRVRPRERTEHPEDPVGTVMTRISTGELLVDFPLAGGELYLDENSTSSTARHQDGSPLHQS